MRNTISSTLRTLLFFLAAGMFLFSCKEDIKLSSEASITSLTLTVGGTDYAIKFTNKEGKITVPYATQLPATATVKAVVLSAKAKGIKVGDNITIPVSGTVTLTVTAEDGKTGVYTVTVEKASASKEASITSLTLTVGDTDYEITFTGSAYTLTLPENIALPTIVSVKTVTLSAGATGVVAAAELPVTEGGIVTLEVTAEDGETKQKYTVTLVASQATGHLFTSFTFTAEDNEAMALEEGDRKEIVGTIDNDANSITFPKQSAYVYLNRLKAAFTTSPGATVQVGDSDQESGVTEQDFSSPVSYVVRAQDGTETTYTVTLDKSTLATIPDAQFRAKLKELFPAAFTEDQLNIMHAEVINNSGTLDLNIQIPKLTSVKGIEFFTGLTGLNCNTNSLTFLDVSKNTALKSLSCVSNSFNSLDVSANTSLEILNCEVNRLSSLDVRENTALRQLYCADNALESLDVSKNTGLNVLRCSNNALDSLDVRVNTALTLLNCRGNALKSLDVSANTALEILYCQANALTSLDVSVNTALTRFRCEFNSLTSLDMTGMRSVKSLNIGDGTGTDNPLLATLRVNTAVQDRAEVITMKTARGAALTVTTVNDAGTEVCADYTPAQGGGTCN